MFVILNSLSVWTNITGVQRESQKVLICKKKKLVHFKSFATWLTSCNNALYIISAHRNQVAEVYNISHSCNILQCVAKQAV